MKDFMLALARTAGDALMDFFESDQTLISLRSTAKEAATKYDKVADQLIIGEIRKSYPEHSILTEESGMHSNDPDWLWIIDSLDGTGNFANHNPLFSVCIALVHEGIPIGGTIYAPAIHELYFAEKGKGAFLNQNRIHVSNVKELSGSYLFYCEGGDTDRLRTVRMLREVYSRVTDIRKLGSAGVETAWVAAGRGEAYFTTQIDPWDVAPGVLLVSEAGGKVTDFRGNPWVRKKSDLIFSNGAVHEDILEIVRKL